VSNVEINDPAGVRSISAIETLNISNDLTITQVGSLSRNSIRVGNNIIITDDAINGTTSLVLAGSGTTTFQGAGNGDYPTLIIDKDNTTDKAQLNSTDVFQEIIVRNGILDLNNQSPGADLTVEANGTLAGTGTVNGFLDGFAGGIVSPGNSPGTLTINGDVNIAGTLIMEITGPGENNGGVAGSDFDQLIVDGSATIGTLSVVFIGTIGPSFPVFGDSYTLLSTTGTSSATGMTITPSNINASYNAGVLIILNPVFPIELTHFSATIKGQAIQLYWNTATEQNNDYMSVERSSDGVKFIELGRVKGAGTTEVPQEYGFIDEKPLSGLNYYRLRQVDFDGVFEYHKAISILFNSRGQDLALQSFPNPAQGFLQARWSPSPTQPTSLLLIDMAGRKLAEYQVAPGVNTFEVPLNELPAAMYFLQVRQGEEVEVMRFLKQ
ncbi:MAG: T9SS type A sorting domain-containing protein, partial [Phaeodactylibacter sp.]|nr:T9SS type A sorting domain-containing protein [Phaeodactylibacter sp.]